ncbi:hypothetical protein EVAR_84144_1 [Eumeta japonica]|uniref:Uncharacterized protein n=1 Tax=Eumeta variegata TaxID=151549 RepID=A0A4C2A7R3_EUMVA|nr:hypothetical protein EVAR_84144_1 [Eumeta japonica]
MPGCHFRDLGLFLAMANKCLELGYFLSLEGGGNQGDPEAGKEDYARPKSYRPIGLLLCWAKQWKGCWSAPPVALNAKTSGDARAPRQRVVAGVGDPAARPCCPVNLHGLVRGYLGPGGSRQVRWRGVQERDFKGCIQGSIAIQPLEPDPGFLLRELGELGVYVRRSRMMWSSCSPDSRLRRSRRRPTAFSSRALLGSQK